MNIITWNVNGLRAVHRKDLFLPFVKKENPDILCLQETKSDKEQLSLDVQNLNGYFSYFASSQIKKGYSGVAVYSKKEPLKVEMLGIQEFDQEGRTLILHFEDFILANAYFPNGGGGPVRLDYKLRFYDAFLEKMETLRKNGKEIIFCGDVNTAHEEIDLARPKENEKNTGFLPEERAWIDEVIAHGYTDIFRKLFPNKTDMYTYWDMKTRARERNVGWRIDYFFVTSGIIPRVKNTDILSAVQGSDHCPVRLFLK